MCIISDYQKLISGKFGITHVGDLAKSEDELLYLFFHLKYENAICKKCNRSIIENYSRVHRKDKNGNKKRCFRCKSCHTLVYPLAGTAFKNTALPLSSVLYITYFLAAYKSHAALKVQKYIGLSYKTCHRLMMNVRRVMVNDVGRKLQGVIEVDEVFIGKGSKFYNWSSISTRKQPILGMLERDTKKLKVFLINNRNKKTLRELILKNIEVDSTIYTDSWDGYIDLSAYYKHESVNHRRKEFARGEVHTNTIENIWGGFKRNIRNAHIQITAKYVDLYMNELSWQYNHKDENEAKRFDRLLRTIFADSTSYYVVQAPKISLIRTEKKGEYVHNSPE